MKEKYTPLRFRISIELTEECFKIILSDSHDRKLRELFRTVSQKEVRNAYIKLYNKINLNIFEVAAVGPTYTVFQPKESVFKKLFEEIGVKFFAEKDKE